MRSLWKVGAVSIVGKEFYQVYRTTDAVKESDRIEKRGGLYTYRAEAEELAKELNEEDGRA